MAVSAEKQASAAEDRDEGPGPQAVSEILQPKDSASRPVEGANGSVSTTQDFNFVDALNAANEAAYTWDIGRDVMCWSPNASEIVKIADLSAINKGGAYNMLVDVDHAECRYEAIAGSTLSDDGNGVGYRIQYRLKPEGRRQAAAVWIEEHGRWYASSTGKPERACGVLRVIDDRQEQDERLRFLSYHDDLTGHINRTRLTEELAIHLETTAATNSVGAFLMASVNNLTHINKTYGLSIGDEVIAIVGRRLEACLRDRDKIGRYGANKFGIMLSTCGAEELVNIASRLLKTVHSSIIETSAGALSTNICIGAVLIPTQAKTVESAFNRSLEALEWARARHNSGFSVYKPSKARETLRQRNIKTADNVLRALNEDRICLSLQPVVRVHERKPAFHEALLCMKAHDGTLISASEFVPVAEELGLVNLLDRRSLELTIALLQASPDMYLSLNVSAQTTANKEWLTALTALTDNKRSIHERLMVEITETAALHEIDESISFVEALKKLGCKVAIDDFGAGYSTFKNLRLLDIDVIKIDGSFVKNIVDSPDDQVFVRMLVELANIFGMETVAEWVGNEPTSVFLEKAGVTYMQGYFFGEPQLVDWSSVQAQAKAS